jgi:hypothetical protein
MKLNSQELITQFRNLLQTELFPMVESSVGPLSKQGKLLVSIVSMAPLRRWVGGRRAHTGRRPCDRQALATAFLAKAVYNLTTTRHLLERLHSDAQLRRLCGWDRADQVPAEATFSRAFAEFAASGLPTQVHEALVRNTQRDRVIAYIARDSTAIEAREHLAEAREETRKAKPAAKPSGKGKSPSKRGIGSGKRRKGGPHKRAKARERGSRLQRQHHMELDEMLAELSRQCSLGVKTSSKGHQQYWRGYKLHWDVADSGRIPISCLLTGASVHDSQVAIPLMQISAGRVKWRCEVMDSAYDAGAIRSKSAQLGHEAIIKPVKRSRKSGSASEFSEQEKARFKKRTIVEQLNGRLKDEFGGRVIYFRGATKIMAHLMFGVIALTVDQLLRTLS